MPQVKKATVGVRLQERMYRVYSLYGQTVDAVLALRGQHPLSEDFFTQVARHTQGAGIRLFGQESGAALNVDLENITYSRDFYETGKHFSFDGFFAEFASLWKAVNDVLKVRNIRRIGIVCEYRFPNSTPSTTLRSQLTKTSAHPTAGRFNLSYESYRNVKGPNPFDASTSDFINVIKSYYDSQLDSENAAPNAFNANLDVQRYYAPLLNSNVIGELPILRKEYEAEAKAFHDENRKLGLTDEKPE